MLLTGVGLYVCILINDIGNVDAEFIKEELF